MRQQKITGGILGLIAAILWFVVDSRVYSSLVLSRLADHWPASLQIGMPIALFGIVLVLPTYYLFTRLSYVTARTAIPSSATLYVLLAAYPYAMGDTTAPAWVTLVADIAFVVVGAIVAWWLANGKRQREGTPIRN